MKINKIITLGNLKPPRKSGWTCSESEVYSTEGILPCLLSSIYKRPFLVLVKEKRGNNEREQNNRDR